MQNTANTTAPVNNDVDSILIDLGESSSDASSEETTIRIYFSGPEAQAVWMIQVGQGIALTLSFIVFSLVFASVGANAPLTQELMLNVIAGNLIISASVFAIWWNARRSTKN